MSNTQANAGAYDYGDISGLRLRRVYCGFPYYRRTLWGVVLLLLMIDGVFLAAQYSLGVVSANLNITVPGWPFSAITGLGAVCLTFAVLLAVGLAAEWAIPWQTWAISMFRSGSRSDAKLARRLSHWWYRYARAAFPPVSSRDGRVQYPGLSEVLWGKDGHGIVVRVRLPDTLPPGMDWEEYTEQGFKRLADVSGAATNVCDCRREDKRGKQYASATLFSRDATEETRGVRGVTTDAHA